MEDPLKPKAVPLAAEMVLWFEFLLDPELITKHLRKPNPEPSAIDLMSQFISTTPDTMLTSVAFNVPTNDTINVTGINSPTVPPTTTQPPSTTDELFLTHKQLALKILTLKVATWLKWNLDIIEKNISLPKQIHLLRDLCTISFGKKVVIPFPPDFQPNISTDGNEKAARFALTFYHRWVLRVQIMKDIAIKSVRPPLPGNMLIATEPIHQFFAPEIPSQNSLEFLQNLCKSNEPFYIFTYETFKPLQPYASDNGETTTEQKFDDMLQISTAELRTQIYFDLVNFYLYTKQYQLARDAVDKCRHNLNLVKAEYEMLRKSPKQFVFCHINEEELEGLLQACGLSVHSQTLTKQFHLSTLTEYKDIVEILKMDNRIREIPLPTRRIVEFNIAAAISQKLLKESRQLEMQVAALNVIRGLFQANNIFINVNYFSKYRKMNCFTTILEYIQDAFSYCSVNEKKSLKQFLIEAILKNPRRHWLSELKPTGILNTKEIQELEKRSQMEKIPSITLLQEWKLFSKLPRIEIGLLERQLISCNSANAVRKLLVKLAATNPTKPLWTVNPSWEIVPPIKLVLMSMQPGFLQDFAYVLLGKGRELTAKQDFVGAVSLLSVLKSETQRPDVSNTPSIIKLGKLVTWEILLTQVIQSLEEWNRKPLDLQSLSNRCKQCLKSFQNGEAVMPRMEIIENCAIMLLNLNEWTSLMSLDKRLPHLEFPIAYAATFIDMEKMKGSKKVCRDAWDLMLTAFCNHSKRYMNTINSSNCSNDGNSNGNSPYANLSSTLQLFLKRIRHQTVFNLAISMLGKMYNILKDDVNSELCGEYMQLWPTTLNGPLSSYSIRSVGETLYWLLSDMLKYYPQMISILKMKGDLELALGNSESAMRCYVNAVVIGTDNCTIPLQRTVADDYLIRKMIRCSSNLGRHMQATILCQFLDEIDYSIVFKNLAEKSSNFTDAMDAYYNCIWDTTLLEFIINLHAKKGEHSRKLEAAAIMGSLELNANNTDDVKREAINARKFNFLRALAKQYLL